MRAAAPDTRERRLGRYTLHGEIASGGMATVHFGRLAGEGGFSRIVALPGVFYTRAGEHAAKEA